MSGLSSRQQTVVVALGLFVTVVAAWFFVVSPKRAEASRLDSQVQVAQDRLAAAQLKERMTREKQQRLAPLPALVRAMPERAEMSRIIRELNRVGAQSGVEFQSITPQPLRLEKDFQVLPLTVDFEGDFVRVSAFLERLRHGVELRGEKLRANGRLFVIESVQLVEGENKLPSLKATLTLDAFVYGNHAPEPVAP